MPYKHPEDRAKYDKRRWSRYYAANRERIKAKVLARYHALKGMVA